MGDPALGALTATSITAAVNALYNRDFAAELAESLRNPSAPLGEVKLAEMLKGRKHSR